MCLIFALAMPSCFGSPITFTNEYVFDDYLPTTPINVESFEDTHSSFDPLMLSTVQVDCTTADGVGCSPGSLTLSSNMPTDQSQGLRFSGTDKINFSWDVPITVFTIDVRNLGVNGPADLIVIVNGQKMTIFSNYTGDNGNTLFFAIEDPDGIRTLSIMATGDTGNIYLDRMMTAAMPESDPSDTAIPEPTTAGLLLSGLAALLAKRKLRLRNEGR
jgi:hypothetical protein